MQFEAAVPIFSVRDLQASVDYYTRVLGFTFKWNDGTMAEVSRGVRIFLCEGDQGTPGTWLSMYVDDADALHDELRASGAKIRHPPTNYSWSYELQVEDLDGNVLRIGSPPKEGVPFGEWLDMHGRRWIQRAGDRWERVG